MESNVERLIADGETYTVEFKSDVNDDELTEAAVCLANGDGGQILIGVAELCRIAPDQASRLLRRMARSSTLRMTGSRGLEPDQPDNPRVHLGPHHESARAWPKRAAATPRLCSRARQARARRNHVRRLCQTPSGPVLASDHFGLLAQLPELRQ